MDSNRIFRADGRSFVLAIDHPLTMHSPDLTDIESVISRAVEGGVDAFMASYGCLLHFSGAFADRGRILRADGGSVIMDRPSGRLRLLYDASDALDVGADALLCMGYPGSQANPDTLENVAKTAREAHRNGLLAGAEMLPYGFERPEGIDSRSVENISFACRLGCELGADFIKTEFTGGEGFSEVVRNCYAPVLVLGGSKAKSEEEIISSVRRAIDAGASGIIMGRNIVRSGNMTALCKEISKIIHN